MPEAIDQKAIFSLSQVGNSIRKTLEDRYRSAFWVKAEMNKLNHYSQSGHCYPELVEKREGKVIAQMKSILWRNEFLMVNSKFLQILNEPLKDGIKILFLARISFDANHGLSLVILDIDPAYTLGDLEQEKQDSIRQLKTENIYLSNKTLTLPLLPQRIAIISVETSKGYADFLQVIQSNAWHYRFFLHLFPAVLQGDKVVAAMVHQLKRIKKVQQHFDVVAIIRGGGGDIGLSCYNNYQLAREIATFPIPVITGIGHATNETVCEMISFYNAITPTKLAEFLIQHFHNFSVPVKRAQEKLVDRSRRLLTEQQSAMQAEAKLFRSVTENMLLTNRNLVKEQAQSLVQQAQFLFRNEKDALQQAKAGMRKSSLSACNLARQAIFNYGKSIKKDTVFQLGVHKTVLGQCNQQLQRNAANLLRDMQKDLVKARVQLDVGVQLLLKTGFLELLNIDKNVSNMSPANVLKRGYSITLLNGKALKDPQLAKEGDKLETLLFEGNISSIVASSKRQAENE